MAIDKNDGTKAGKEKTPSQHQSAAPSGPPEAYWIMHSLNQILEQFDKVERRIQVQINGLQAQINGLEARLQRFERLFWVCQGMLIAVLVIWAVVQLLVSNYQIALTLKP